MKKLEHWAHRLYPKFQFDDCLDKIAALGKKKGVSVCLFNNFYNFYFICFFILLYPKIILLRHI